MVINEDGDMLIMMMMTMIKMLMAGRAQGAMQDSETAPWGSLDQFTSPHRQNVDIYGDHHDLYHVYEQWTSDADPGLSSIEDIGGLV